MDCSPPGSPVPGILQARTLEWGAIAFSNAWKWKVKVKSLSRVWLPATPWTAAHQAPQSMGFSRQEYWSGVPLPSPDLGASKNQTGDSSSYLDYYKDYFLSTNHIIFPNNNSLFFNIWSHNMLLLLFIEWNPFAKNCKLKKSKFFTHLEL